MTEKPTGDSPQSDNPEPSEPAELRILDSGELLAGGRSVVIRHDNEFYRLAVTRNGKLILQK